MIVKIPNLNDNNTGNDYLNLWGGLGYSVSHTLTDMFGFESRTGFVYDMFSLYTAAPFVDTETNINGTNNIVVIGNSYDLANVRTDRFFIQFYRLYALVDNVSD